MLRTIQIMHWFLKNGYGLDEIINEMNQIVDNGYSQRFELKPYEIDLIGRVYNSDRLFNMALFTASEQSGRNRVSLTNI